MDGAKIFTTSAENENLLLAAMRIKVDLLLILCV